MQRLTIAALAGTVLATVLVTGCAEDYTCKFDSPVYFNTEDGRYHYDNVGGPLVPDEEVEHHCARDSDGVDAGGVEIDIDVPKTKPGASRKTPPKVTAPKAPAAPAPKPAAPRPAAPRTKR